MSLQMIMYLYVWDFCKESGILVDVRGFIAKFVGEVSPPLAMWPAVGERESEWGR